jgi:SRSO17 transposase
MITTKPDEEQKETEEDRLVQRIRETLTDLQARIGPHFRRAEVRSRAGRFLEGLLANVPRKNGWQMAEELGENGPRGVQRLLGEADWDEDAVRDELRSYVREHLGEAGGLLVMDETGFLKKGKKSAGVARQYSGTAGRRENSQIGVFLLYASSKGYAFLDRELYLPEEWTVDRVRCREAGIPDAVGFATKGELAHQMLVRAFEARVPAQWVVGDTVYGYEELRLFLEEHDKNYVLAIPETHTLWVQGEPRSVGLLAALLPQEAWTVLSAGEGSKGERLYEWAWLQLPEQEPASQGKLHWVLIRRSLSNPNERAYYRVYGPADITLAELARVAGGRWHIEEGLEQTKGEVGLDQYEVRGFRAWYRHVTLALLAHAVLAVLRAQVNGEEKKVELSRNTARGALQSSAAWSMSCGNRQSGARTGYGGPISEGSIKQELSAAIDNVVPLKHP